MSDEARVDPGPDDLRTVYEHVCTSYHAIDDFRAKLLGFLPLVSGAGVFILLSDAFVDPTKQAAATRFLLPIGIFGIVVTLGLFAYEIYGIRRCHALIRAGKRIERSLHIRGHFRRRPREVAGFINEPFAAGIIYPAVLAAWTYLALVFTLERPWMTAAVSALVFLVGLAGSLAYASALEKEGRGSRRATRAYGRAASTTGITTPEANRGDR